MKSLNSFGGLKSSITVRYPENTTVEVVHYDEVVAKMDVDWPSKTVHVEQYSADKLVIPFPTLGEKVDVSTEKFVDYLESRCFPRTRDNAQELLEMMGLTAYNPYKIVRTTHGVIFDDYIWLRFKGEEDLKYEDVGLRKVPQGWKRSKNTVDQ